MKNESEKQEKRLTQEDKKPVPWTRLYEEARDRYEETARPRRDRVLWTSILLFSTTILVVCVWGLYNRVTQLRKQSDEPSVIELTSNPNTQAVSAELVDEPTQTPHVLVISPTVVDTTTQMATPTPDLEPTATMTITAELLVPTDTEIVPSCENDLGYIFEIISGPVLSPLPGYLLNVGSEKPLVQSSWIIRNDSNCSIKEILFLNVKTGEKTVPLILQNGEKVDLNLLEQAINPGDDVEVVLGYTVTDTLNVDNEWILVVNGFELNDQPHLLLKIQNWIILVDSTITPTQGIKPTNPPKPTDPPIRPTNTPPVRPSIPGN